MARNVRVPTPLETEFPRSGAAADLYLQSLWHTLELSLQRVEPKMNYEPG